MNRNSFHQILLLGLVSGMLGNSAPAQTVISTSVQSTAGGSAQAGASTLVATAGQASPPGQASSGQFTLFSGYLYTIDAAAQLFTDIAAPLTGVYGSSTAWGDYDNDGDLDILLTGNSGTGAIAKIYRNDNGSFVEIAATLTPGNAATWGDYDNDGDLDILLGVKIFRNTNGNFVDIGVSLTGNFTIWGDYDNDGDLDVLATNTNNCFKIYRNDQGSFVNVPMSLPQGEGIKAAFGDYDNDGDLDIFLAGVDRSSLPLKPITKLFRNDGGDFVDAAVDLSVPGYYADNICWGDYDGDGDLDILLTIGLFTGAKVYRNDAGTFNLTASMELSAYGAAAWGDYDNDGDLDITLTGLIGDFDMEMAASRVYRNDNGTFVHSVSLTGMSRGSVSWGDYDNDGDLDLLLTGRLSGLDPVVAAAKIYRNDISTPNTVPAAPANLVAAVQSNSAILSWNKSIDNQTPRNGLTYNLRLGTSPGGVQKVSPMADVATGYRRVPQLGNVNHNTSWPIKNLPPGLYYWSVQALDNAFAGSAFAAEQSFTIGPQPFTDIAAPLEGVLYSDAAWGDYDNDGDLDILIIGGKGVTASSRVYRNDGGNFVTTWGFVEVEMGAVDWGDYDNDGDLDILLTGVEAFGDPPKEHTKIYRNDAGQFVDIAAAITGVSTWVDYDNDGDLDLAGSKLYRNDRSGFVDIGSALGSPRGAWGDYDNDGDQDQLAGNKIYRNDGSVFIEIPAALPGMVNASSVAWGDYDNDGDLDVLLTGSAGVVPNTTIVTRVYRNEGGSFADISAGLIGVGGSVVWGDYDNDGDLDILLAGFAAGAKLTKVYRNDNGNFIDMAAGFPGVDRGSVDWGDYDNDGDLDILLTGLDALSFRLAKIYRNNIGTANTAPTAPTGLTAAVIAGAVTFSWENSTDNQTAQNALTYNLWVGQTPSGNEIVAPMADVTTGYRRIPKLGNTNHRTSWTIKNLPPGKYYWSVQALDNAFAGSAFAAGQSLVTRVESDQTIALPETFALYANSPNPFNSGTTIKYDLAQPVAVHVEIFDLLGKLLRRLVNEQQPAGRYSIVWDGRDENGQTAASGVFIYQLRAGSFVQSRKMLMVR